jgi:hypothetical protein
MPEIKYFYDDCSVGFYCPKCGTQLIADSQDGWKECDCGLKFRLNADLEVVEPK